EKRILIHSDSKYVINCAQKIWKRKKNIDLWNLYDNIITNKNIKYKWVKGHNNNFWNEKVDKIANQSRLELY
ncbi:MAG: RNase H family protein, partial [Planctomycetota bacterium]